jgi:hypothetical protein
MPERSRDSRSTRLQPREEQTAKARRVHEKNPAKGVVVARLTRLAERRRRGVARLNSSSSPAPGGRPPHPRVAGTVAAMPTLLCRVLAVAAAAYALAGVSTALAAPNPLQNMPVPVPSSCLPPNQPTSAACENAAVSNLDGAHSALGLPAYTLPADFDSLAPVDQMLILSNDDRLDYGLQAIVGLSSSLNSAAALGITDDTDPDPAPYLPAGLELEGWTANWAGRFPNALLAYYEWMYDDGPGGPNIDCVNVGDPGCWSHRQDVLAFQSAGAILMGAAAGYDPSDEPGFTMTLVATAETDTNWTTLTYTWAQAQADIAGSAGGSGSGGSGSGSGGSGSGASGGSGSGSGGSGSGSGGSGSGGSGSGSGGSGSGSGGSGSGSGGSGSGGSGSGSGGSGSGSGGSGSGSGSSGGSGSGSGTSGSGSSGTAPSGAGTPSSVAPTPDSSTTRVAPLAVISSVTTSGHTVSFVLDSSAPATAFQCALVRDRHHSAHFRPHYTSCDTVNAYEHLARGRYTLYARALGLGGIHRRAVKRSFSIR